MIGEFRLGSLLWRDVDRIVLIICWIWNQRSSYHSLDCDPEAIGYQLKN
jgi:hypothetical protein